MCCEFTSPLCSLKILLARLLREAVGGPLPEVIRELGGLLETKNGDRLDDILGLMDGLRPGLDGPPELVLSGEPRLI